MISLQVRYIDNEFNTGNVIAIRPDGYLYSEGDCKQGWVNSERPIDSYNRKFVIFYISDCQDDNHKDLTRLMEKFSDEIEPPHKRKVFIEIPKDQDKVNLINKSGELTVTLSDINSFAVER